jgi:peptidoglycan/xylan/chitin deacetylase (PgdA/CDA1 family)
MAQPLVAFFYHTVSDSSLPHVTPLYPCKSPDQLERDLVYLKGNFTLVGHEELVAACDGRKPLPPRAASISFDDGFAGCFSLVRPLLLKHRIPCTFFLIRDVVGNHSLMYRNTVALCLSQLETWPSENEVLDAVARKVGRRFATRRALRGWIRRLGFDDDRLIGLVCEALNVDVDAYLRERHPYVTTEEVLRLHADGFTIGAHSVSHPQLGAMPWDCAQAQIVDSCDYIRNLTGKPRVPFAFPFNGIGLSRGRLGDLRREAGSIDLMYDTNYLMNDADFIVNRIPCDAPPRSAGSPSNLPTALKRARALEPARAVKRWFAGYPH